MPGSFYTSSKIKINYGNLKIRKGYCGTKLVYTCGNSVTYVVNGTNYEEDVEEGATVLSPTSFTPSKYGWTFRGWSNQAGSTYIQTNLKMGNEPMTLYAVWSKTEGDSVPDQNTGLSYSGPADGCNLNPGGSWTATVSAGALSDAGNSTGGYLYPSIIVGGTTIRKWVSVTGADDGFINDSDTRGDFYEASGTPGYGGRSCTISGTGNITASVDSDGCWKISGGDISVTNVIRKGYDNTHTVWSVG